MAKRKQTALAEPSARSIAQKARRQRELASISDIVDKNLNPVDAWRHVHPEHIEAIKTRLIGGDTLGRVCRDLKLDRASVVRHFHENETLLKQYLNWKAMGAHILYENLLELPFDKTMSKDDKMLYYKIVSNYAPKINRADYGNEVNVNQTVTIKAAAIPEWLVGEVVDGQIVDDLDPTV